MPDDLLPDFGDVREEVEGVLEPVDPDEPLRDGVRLPSALGDWEVLETPGHAPSHICLLQRERGIAIVGDLVARAFAPYFDYGYTPDPVGEFLQSLEKVEDAGPRLCLPGHGRTFTDVRGHIHAYRRLVADRLQKVLDAIGVEPLSGIEIIPHVYGQALTETTAAWWMSETLAYLQHLEMTGRAARIEGEPDRWRAA